MIDCCMPNPSAGGNSRRALGIWRIYDTRRDRSLLERTTQLEVVRLLLQGRSASDRTKASQVDGLDGEFRAPERSPDHIAFDRISGCSIARRESPGSREWHRADYWSRVHHRFVLGMRLFVFTHGMRTSPPKTKRWRQQPPHIQHRPSHEI